VTRAGVKAWPGGDAAPTLAMVTMRARRQMQAMMRVKAQAKAQAGA